MTGSTRRRLKEGLEFGLIAGLIFASLQIAGAVAVGARPVAPLWMAASVVLGRAALGGIATGHALAVGAIAHLLLSAVFGLVYGAFAAQLPVEMQANRGKQVWLGLCFGAALWLVNFQIIAVLFYPWFLRTPQLLQLSMHALFFGLPLTLMYSAAERRAPRHAKTSTLNHRARWPIT